MPYLLWITLHDKLHLLIITQLRSREDGKELKMYRKGKDIRKKDFCFWGEVSNSWILNDIGRNSLLGNIKKIAKFLMRTLACRSTFLYGVHRSLLTFNGLGHLWVYGIHSRISSPYVRTYLGTQWGGGEGWNAARELVTRVREQGEASLSKEAL